MTTRRADTHVKRLWTDELILNSNTHTYKLNFLFTQSTIDYFVDYVIIISAPVSRFIPRLNTFCLISIFRIMIFGYIKSVEYYFKCFSLETGTQKSSSTN